MRDLSSAGSATAARAAVENRLTPAVSRIVHVFLARVRRDAYGALDAPVLLAAGRAPFSLNNVTSLWAGAAEGILTEVIHATGRTRGQTLTRYERAVLGRLGAAPISQDAYESVRDVLTTAVDQSWSRNRTEGMLRETLAPTTPSYVRTADGLTHAGPTWQATADRIARTEATAAFGSSTLDDLAAGGATTARWVSHHDARVRPEHLEANGQTVRLGEDFNVGGYLLSFPSDPKGPPSMTAQCRCVLTAGPVDQAMTDALLRVGG